MYHCIFFIWVTVLQCISVSVTCHDSCVFFLVWTPRRLDAAASANTNGDPNKHTINIVLNSGAYSYSTEYSVCYSVSVIAFVYKTRKSPK